MKELKKLLKKPSVFLGFSIFVALLTSGVIIYFLILPKFQSYFDKRNENKKLEEEISDLEISIKAVSSLDKGEAARFSKITSLLIPEEEDTLRFITLSEILAKASGVRLTAIQLNVSKSVGTGQSTPAPAQTNSGQNQATTPPAAPAKKSSYQLGVTIEGNFRNIMRFVSSYQNTDRLAGMNELTISGLGSALSANMVVELPISSDKLTLTLGENVTLSQGEREKILSIIGNSKFSAFPAQNPLGRPDPFK